jgi:hypothetical protein
MNNRTASPILLIGLATAALLAAAPARATDSPPAGMARALERSALSAAAQADITARARETEHAGIPAEDVEIIIGRGLERGADAVILNSFLETVVRTKQQGLPVRPVLDRIEQGLSKGVPPERIDAAVKRLADGLAKAKPLVDRLLQNGLPPGTSGTNDAALESVARAGEQTLSAGTMQGLGEKVRAQGQSLDQFVQAVRTLSFLAGNGMPADAAERVVQAGIERGLTERDYGRLERKVGDMVRQGHSMEDIVGAAEREVREQRGNATDSRGMLDRGPGTGRDTGGRGGRGR